MESNISRVAAVRVTDYAPESVVAGIGQALTLLGGLEQFVQSGDRVLLKPNLLEGVPVECAVTTHPEVLRAVIRQVRALGAVPVVGDSPGWRTGCRLGLPIGRKVISRPAREFWTVVLAADVVRRIVRHRR